MIESLWNAYAAVRGRHLPRLAGASSSADLFCDADLFRRHMLDGIIPFWQKYSVDIDAGGFVTHLRCDGSWYETRKTTAMQARMIYAFSTAYRFSGDAKHLEVARGGLDFMRTHLWDRTHGGWLRCVDRNGTPLDSEKPAFHQAYAIVGLCEHFAATRDTSVLALACESYDLARTFLHDAGRGGYRLSCASDWRTLSMDKTVCSQLDMTFAALSLYRATQEQRYFNDALDLAHVMLAHMYHKRFSCLVETCNDDWSYNPFATRDTIWFGHNLKAAWVLLQLNQLEPRAEWLDAARSILNFCIEFGYDRGSGGFFHYAYRSGPLASGEKLWWTNCEALMALLLASRVERTAAYAPYFTGTLDFCMNAFYDAERGEWFRSCASDGAILNSTKGGADKAAYHTVQACAYAYEYLQAAEAREKDG